MLTFLFFHTSRILKIQYIVVRVDYSVAIATSNRRDPF
jgi:hypothetical protein